MHMQRSAGTWCCGVCVAEGWWGVSHLIESAVTFSDTCCAPKSAAYLVLVWFHANSTTPEPQFLHSRAPPGCEGLGEIQDPVLYQDLCDRQRRRLHQGQDPHGKLKHLLDCPPLTRPVWFWPDMMSEQHVLTY